ncbi:MAG: DsbA family oxidoreductase [Asticcacaulis sp.]
MKIDIWSDVVCPFCYIGKANLDAALKEAGVTADIRHKAFRLQPGQSPVLVDDMLAKKYGLTGPAAVQQQKRVVDMAAQAGLDFHLGGTFIGDTTDAHRLIKFAATQGREAEMLDRLYRAYFTEKRDVLGRDSLLDLAEDAGLDREAATAALASDAFTAEVATDQRMADSLNVRGVPFVVIDGKYAVSGAQPVTAFVQAILAAAPLTVVAAEGDACGIDGCD